MDRLHEELARVGRLDSQGHFTVDTAMALRMMRGRLLQAEDCLLYLLQSAVASGATDLRVTRVGSEIRLRHDGLFPTPEEAPQILTWALGAGQQVAYHRLGLALAACLSSPGNRLTLDFPDGSAKSIRAGRGDALIIEDATSCNQGQATGQFRLNLREGWWRRLWGGSVALDRLCQRARFAPLQLIVEGEQVAGVDFGEPRLGEPGDTTRPGENYRDDHHCLEMRLLGPGPDRLGLPDSKASRVVYVDPPSGDDPRPRRHCWAALAWRMGRTEDRAEVIHYGVSLAPVRLPRQPSRLWILLADHRVDTDLTCLKPVQNHYLLEKLGQLQDQFFQLLSGPLQEEYRAFDLKHQPFEVWVVKRLS